MAGQFLVRRRNRLRRQGSFLMQKHCQKNRRKYRSGEAVFSVKGGTIARLRRNIWSPQEQPWDVALECRAGTLFRVVSAKWILPWRVYFHYFIIIIINGMASTRGWPCRFTTSTGDRQTVWFSIASTYPLQRALDSRKVRALSKVSTW